MPSAFGIVRSGKARVQAIASPLDSENFDKAGALFGGALQMALGWQSRGPNGRAHFQCFSHLHFRYLPNMLRLLLGKL